MICSKLFFKFFLRIRKEDRTNRTYRTYRVYKKGRLKVSEVAFAEALGGRRVCRHNDQEASQREAWKKEGRYKANARHPDDS